MSRVRMAIYVFAASGGALAIGLRPMARIQAAAPNPLQPTELSAAAVASDDERMIVDEEAVGQLRPLPSTTRVIRHVNGTNGVAVAGAGPDDRLIYSNTLGTLYYAPRRNLRFADDLGTTSVNGCNMTKYLVGVTGGVTNGIGVFSCRVRLYTGCPNTNGGFGTLIPGTEREFTNLPDDVALVHELVVDLSDAPLPIPPTVWCRVDFDTDQAGWVVGAPAEIGFSGDVYDHAFTGCGTSFGGWPKRVHASFYAQVFAAPTCETHHLVYGAFSSTGQLFATGQNKLFADDVRIVEGVCELSAYEVGMRGTAGPFTMNFELRPRFGTAPFAGTQRIYESTRGNGVLEIARFTFPPGIFIEQDNLWLVWKANKNATGLVLANRTQAGKSDPEAYEWKSGQPRPWTEYTPDPPKSGIYRINIYCRGEPEPGACCAGRRSGEPVRCYDVLPAASCGAARWLPDRTCAEDAFDPPCGTHACCLPDNRCTDLDYEDCTAITATGDMAVFCSTNEDCGVNRYCQADGTCSPRTALWSAGEFCDDSDFRCPLFECQYGEGECYSGRPICGFGEVAPCSDRRGCSNFTCCNDICDADDFCCAVVWDSVCADQARTMCSHPPANDECAGDHRSFGAREIPMRLGEFGGEFFPGGQIEVFNQHATVNYSDDPRICCVRHGSDTQAENTVWYKFAMPQSAHTTARIHTCRSPDGNADSILQVFRAGDSTSDQTACDSLTVIGCNDDHAECGGGYLSDVCVGNLVSGETYYIMVGLHPSSDAGVYRLDVEIPCPRAIAANDDCDHALALPTGEAAIQVPFDLAGATLSCPPEPCSEMRNDIWFDFTAPCTGGAIVATAGVRPIDPHPLTAIAVYSVTDPPAACPPISIPLFCTVDTATFPVTAGNLYKIRLGGINGEPAGHLIVKCRADDCQLNGVPDQLEIASGASSDCNLNQRPDECDLTVNPAADCDGNEIIDVCEIDSNSTAPGGPFFCTSDCAADCNRNGVLDECEIRDDGALDCNRNSRLDICEIAGGPFCTTGCGSDCNRNGLLDSCEIIGPINRDCNRNGRLDVCDIREDSTAPGRPFFCTTECDPDCDSNGSPDQCVHPDDDCNGNRIPDICDIASGTSHDCQQNSRPDECELGGNDCQLNGIPDDCDIATGQSSDCDGNGIPDECTLRFPQVMLSDELPQDEFGASVALQGDRLLVAAPGDSTTGGAQTGTVYVYRRENSEWVQEAQLTAPDGAHLDRFGGSVSLDGQWAIAGAPLDDHAGGTDAGSAYVFRREGLWVFDAKLTASDAAAGSLFGWAVSLSVDRAVVGAFRHDVSGKRDAGAAYVFRREGGNWVQEAQLRASDAAENDYFGYSVSQSGELIAIGARGHDHDGHINSGAVYVFRRAGFAWMEEAELTLSDVSSLGRAVSISGDRILAGAFAGTSGEITTGVVQVFRKDGPSWVAETQLLSSVPSAISNFGSSISVSGAWAAVGNSSHVFHRAGSTWTRQFLLVPNALPDANSNSVVSVSGELVAVGLVYDTGFPHFNAVNIFDLPPAACTCPSGTITFIDPPDGVIDARQPHAMDGSYARQGITSFLVAAPEGASIFCWRVCETSTRGLPSNEVRTLVDNGDGTHTITIARPITPGAVTTLSYTDVAGVTTTGTFIAHPGNANTDGRTDARDLLALVNYLNGAASPPFGAYSADIDGSGELNVRDYTRLIDLLNGAAAFDRWLGTPIPQAAGCP